MEHNDGEIAAPPEDRLSALPVDILIDILLKLRDAAAAARTSGLSRHWRHLWALLPELYFHPATRPNDIRAAIESNEALALRRLEVEVIDPTPESLEVWLPTAADRLSGDLQLSNEVRNGTEGGGAVELPCFEDATGIRLDLGALALAMPPLGVFAGLTELFLSGFELRGPCMLGDAVSSPRCPALRKLTVRGAWGLANLAIHSDSLQEIELANLEPPGDIPCLGNFTIHSESLLLMHLIRVHNMQQLTVFAPALQVLNVLYCFAHGDESTCSEPAAEITAPRLMSLNWKDACEPFTKFNSVGNLEWLTTYPFHVYGQAAQKFSNDWFLCLMQRFVLVQNLRFSLVYLLTQTACPSGCVCDQPPNWKIQELTLSCLQEVTISKLRGTEHEAALIKRLFDWATALEKITIAFHGSIPESKANEFFQMLQSFSRPAICMKGPCFS